MGACRPTRSQTESLRQRIQTECLLETNSVQKVPFWAFIINSRNVMQACMSAAYNYPLLVLCALLEQCFYAASLCLLFLACPLAAPHELSACAPLPCAEACS